MLSDHERRVREQFISAIARVAAGTAHDCGIDITRLAINIEFSDGDLCSAFLPASGDTKLDEATFFGHIAQKRAADLGFDVDISKPRRRNGPGARNIQGHRRPGRRPRKR